MTTYRVTWRNTITQQEQSIDTQSMRTAQNIAASLQRSKDVNDITVVSSRITFNAPRLSYK